ncbi:MAG: undecaprenyl-diphosphatase UppP [Planctomycetes bacterium]|nr:undecaprenyl-diphosphatase UppP [Planctomycetota bacterium]
MDMLKTIFLAIVQGLTEFLPVSSSGHLVIFEHALHVKRPGLILEVALHLGTLLAIVVVYRREIWGIIRGFFVLIARRNWRENVSGRFAVAIVVGSVPTAAIGLVFKAALERMFESLTVVGIALVVTALALGLTRYAKEKNRDAGDVGLLQAVLIGIAQGIAIIPGISRSGSTISCGLLFGVNRETAARYSFLLSIPAILGATVLEARDAAAQQMNWLPVILGAIVSFGVGYLALRLLLRFVKRGKLHLFAWYCLPVGLLAFVLSLG